MLGFLDRSLSPFLVRLFLARPSSLLSGLVLLSSRGGRTSLQPHIDALIALKTQYKGDTAKVYVVWEGQWRQKPAPKGTTRMSMESNAILQATSS